MIKAITANVIPPNVPSTRKGAGEKNKINNINNTDKYTDFLYKFNITK